MKYHRENYDINKICPLWTDYQVVKLIKPSSTILEIGPATGYIGKFLKEKMNCKVYGVEIDKEAVKLALPYYEKLIVGDVEDDRVLQQIDIKFDYVLCMNVLEHLKNPENVLIKLKNFLKDDSYIIIAIPNIAIGQ